MIFNTVINVIAQLLVGFLQTATCSTYTVFCKPKHVDVKKTLTKAFLQFMSGASVEMNPPPLDSQFNTLIAKPKLLH